MSQIVTSQEPGGCGFFILQHHEFEERDYELDLRGLIAAVRVKGRDSHKEDNPEGLGHWIEDPEARGDLSGFLHWPRNTRDIGTWREIFPAIVTGAAGAGQDANTAPTITPGPGGGNIDNLTPGAPVNILPCRKEKWEADDRFDTIRAFQPPADGCIPHLPKGGVFGLALASQDENEQIEYFVPIGYGQLVAVNRQGTPTIGSLVADLDPEDRLARTVCARLQSAWRVIRRPKSTCVDFGFDDQLGVPSNTLALQIGRSGRGDARGGMAFDRDSRNSIGMLSHRQGGIMEVCPGCTKHVQGVDADGHVIRPMHEPLNVLVSDPEGVMDGPRRHDGVYNLKLPEAPFKTRTFYVYDATIPHVIECHSSVGKHKWYGTSYKYTPEDEPPDIPETPDKPPDKPPPTEGPPPTGGGGGPPRWPGQDRGGGDGEGGGLSDEDKEFIRQLDRWLRGLGPAPVMPGDPDEMPDPEDVKRALDNEFRIDLNPDPDDPITHLPGTAEEFRDFIELSLSGEDRIPPTSGEELAEDLLEPLANDPAGLTGIDLPGRVIRLDADGRAGGSVGFVRSIEDVHEWTEGDRVDPMGAEIWPTGLGTIVGRPQLYQSGAWDLRRSREFDVQDLREYDKASPAVGRMEWIGKQRDDEDGFEPTVEPTTGRSRYPGGSADGALLFMPPERGAEDYMLAGTAGDIITRDQLSEVCFGLAAEVPLVIGFDRTNPATGKPTDGWRFRKTADDKLALQPIDATGNVILTTASVVNVGAKVAECMPIVDAGGIGDPDVDLTDQAQFIITDATYDGAIILPDAVASPSLATEIGLGKSVDLINDTDVTFFIETAGTDTINGVTAATSQPFPIPARTSYRLRSSAVGEWVLANTSRTNTIAFQVANAASQNNYSPAGFTQAGAATDRIVLRVNNTVASNITGLLAQADGKQVQIFNVGIVRLDFLNQSGSSLAANRFLNSTGSFIRLQPNESVTYVYDATASRYRDSAMR